MASAEKPLINFQRSFYVQTNNLFPEKNANFCISCALNEMDVGYLERERQEKQKYLTQTDLKHKQEDEDKKKSASKMGIFKFKEGTFKTLFNVSVRRVLLCRQVAQ